MESLVARLLKDFEAGRMDRRQLIQSIAMAAAAIAAPALVRAEQAPVGAPPPNLVNQPPMQFKAVSVDHVSYQVADYARTRDYYVSLFGMQVTDDDHRSQCQLHFGDHGSFILPRNRRQPGARMGGAANAAAAPAPQSAAMPPATGQAAAPMRGLVDHISYKIDDWNTDRVQAELERRGIKPFGGRGFTPDTGGPTGPKNYASFHLEDPDGFNLQISGELKPGDRLYKG